MRDEHTFQFSAREIAEAANAEANYHDQRLEYWRERAAAALETVKQTIGAKVIERDVTGGKQVDVVVDYGDPEAWREYQLASQKMKSHEHAMERFTIDATLYSTQGDITFPLDRSDVAHFRLGGEPRED